MAKTKNNKIKRGGSGLLGKVSSIPIVGTAAVDKAIGAGATTISGAATVSGGPATVSGGPATTGILTILFNVISFIISAIFFIFVFIALLSIIIGFWILAASVQSVLDGARTVCNFIPKIFPIKKKQLKCQKIPKTVYNLFIKIISGISS